jgi:HD superfamily phosphodiesterase
MKFINLIIPHGKHTKEQNLILTKKALLHYMTAIQKHVYQACEKRTWDWKRHIDSVVYYSHILAKKRDADTTVCVLAALLHDIVKIEENQPQDHHIKGTKRAEEILKLYQYDETLIRHVQSCILSHSSDATYPPETHEAEIVANADALSHFDNFIALTEYFLVEKKLSITECSKRLLQKYAKAWNKITLPEAKELARPKYNAIQTILSPTM